MLDKLEQRLRAEEQTGFFEGGRVFARVAGREHRTGGKPIMCLRNPDGPEALAEITRLKGKVERLTKEADDHAEAANRWRNEWGEARSLIDELVEGLTDIGSTDRIPRRVRTLCLALISKARSSGKAGSGD